jgi:hypothetical protein
MLGIIARTPISEVKKFVVQPSIARLAKGGPFVLFFLFKMMRLIDDSSLDCMCQYGLIDCMVRPMENGESMHYAPILSLVHRCAYSLVTIKDLNSQ